MKITVTNFLGVQSANIPLADTPCAVVGPNASGKTSIATAVAALLTRNPNPLGFSATKSPYLFDGADYGEIAIVSDDGQELVRWVLAEKDLRVFAEAPDEVRVHTTTLVDFIAMPTAKRVDLWEEVFLPKPSELTEMITKELQQRIARENVLEEVLKTLRLHSWKAATEQYKGSALEAERAWAKVTGTRFGSAKAKKWVPSDWRSDYEGVTVIEADRNLEDAREALRTIQVAQAITESQAAEGEEATAQVVALEERYHQLEQDALNASADLRKAEEPMRALTERGKRARVEHDAHLEQKPTADDSVPCPDCGCRLIIGKDWTLTKASDEEAFNRKLRIWSIAEKKLKGDLDALREQFDELDDSEFLGCERRNSDLAREKNDVFNDLTLARRKATKSKGTVVGEEYEARLGLGEQQVNDAMKAKTAIENKHKADDLYRSSLDYRGIAAALGPEGIRGQAMKKGLAELDQRLKDIADLTGWEKPGLDKAYAVLYGERYAVLCSASEQWRTQFMLRAALAIVMRSDRILADGADILLGSTHQCFMLLAQWLSDEHKVHSIVFQATEGEGSPFPVHWRHVSLESGRGSSVVLVGNE